MIIIQSLLVNGLRHRPRLFQKENFFCTFIKKIFLILIVCFFAQLCLQVQAYNNFNEDVPTFKLNVSQEQFLPPAMYGTWSIVATVLKSDAPPGAYAPYSNELWTLTRENNEIMLKNIVSNAAAKINVDKVEGNTATFHHIANAKHMRMKIIETPTVTVNLDSLKGMSRQEVIFYDKKGKPRFTYHLEMKIEGSRLADSRVTFKNPFENPPRFEIAPLQFQD